MSVYAIPLIPAPQTFGITLGGVPYTFTLQYRETTWDSDEGGWFLDIADSSNNPILQGISLVTGANLLAQYDYLMFGGGLFVQTLSDPDTPPTFANLGDDGQLFWVTNP